MKMRLFFLLFINGFTIFAEKNSDSTTSFFREFHEYKNIMDYLQQLSLYYPERVTLTSIGRSVENRIIPVVKISLDKNHGKNKPVILVDANIHAREWMTNAVALYLIQQLVESEEREDMTKYVDWYIIPMLNPDGYEYTAVHRQWRKNRAEGDDCNGVDLNRNFGYHWGESNASPGECHINYEGKKPFSEPETRAFRDFVLQNRKKIKLSVSLHSYGELITFPYGYTDLKVSKMFDKIHQNLGNLVANTINSVRGSNFRAGRQSVILYNASGLSIDWMAGVAKIPLCFLMEINTRDLAFTPPPNEIMPTSLEVFEGFKVFHKYVEQRWPHSDSGERRNKKHRRKQH